jgi:outer membrane protein
MPPLPRSVLILALSLSLGAAVASAQTEAPKIGVFDPETLWKVTEVGKQFNADLSTSRDRLQGDIDKKQQEIDALREKMRQQSASLSDDRMAQMSKDVQNKMIELNRMNDDATREMKSQLGDVQNRFQQMLVETVEAFGKEKNLLLILNKGVIDYNAPSIDVTQELVAKFNEMHKPVAPTAAKTPARKPVDKPADKKPAEKPKEAPKGSDGGH